MRYAAGIDLGGTKIEARLFDDAWNVAHSRRVSTPTNSYSELLNALLDQVTWLTKTAHQDDLAIGIGIPGIVDRQSGEMLTANLPATGQTLPRDLAELSGRKIVVINDCRAFTLSEARLGAGRDFGAVVGLVLGTGLAGGYCINGALVPDLNGIGGEMGHIPMPATFIRDTGLPVIKCGCGRDGCYETYAAGPGMTRIGEHVMGRKMLPADIVAGARANDLELDRVYRMWLALVGELIASLILTLDPECIVLGGGLSNLPDVANDLTNSAQKTLFANTRMPLICVAQGGDSSGTRGAALAAGLEAGWISHD
jgi:N-acetylglucosamine kinase